MTPADQFPPRRLRVEIAWAIEPLESRCLLSGGDLDPTFGDGGKVMSDTGVATAITIQPDGKIIVGGDGFVNRYNFDGSLDLRFAVINGRIGTDIVGPAVALDSSGRVIVVASTPVSGQGSNWALSRFTADGVYEGGFVTEIIGTDVQDGASGVAIAPDGKIIVVGNAFVGGRFGNFDFVTARYNPDLSLDTSFGTNGIVVMDFADGDFASSVAIQPNGAIVVGGLISDGLRFGLMRLDSSGHLDSTFGIGGKVFTGLVHNSSFGSRLALQSDGKVVIATSTALARYDTQGILDSTFGSNGQVAVDFTPAAGLFVRGMTIQPDDAILAYGGINRFAITRYSRDGALDLGFGTGGMIDTDFGAGSAINGIALQADSRIVAAGFANVLDRFNPHIALARYHGGTPTPTSTLAGRVFDDLDNDGAYEPATDETGIAGITVQLFDQANILVNSKVTDADGAYNFAGLAPGTYSIVEVQPSPSLAFDYLDGKERAGGFGGSVNNAQDANEITNIVISTSGAGDGYLFAEIRRGSMQGLVWEDFNGDGDVNFGEKAIAGVTISLIGVDDRGNSLSMSQDTDSQGIYEFGDLRPGTYSITEIQPPNYLDGTDALGTVDGAASGANTSNDQFGGVVLPLSGSSGINYNFAEQPQTTGPVTGGQAAVIGFWHNNSGQTLIRSLNGGPASTQLADWLATTFPTMYGSLAGTTNAEVAAHYQVLFKYTGKTSPGGSPPKLDAQVFAVALAVYVTNSTLAGATAAPYGFAVTNSGLGAATYNIAANGAAFGVANNTQLAVLDILYATESQTFNEVLYDANGNGAISNFEKMLRQMAQDVYAGINDAGGL